MVKRKPAKRDKGDTRKPGKTRRQWKPAFLKAFRESANVRSACEAAKIARQTAYEAYKADDAFARDWDAAEQDACDLLELEARRRAYAGTAKPITFKGVVTATYLEYSDALLMFLLKAHRPEKFSERVKQEHAGETVLRVVYDNERTDGPSPDAASEAA